jgi:Pathogenicity locus
LISVGPAIARDFQMLGIRTVPQLARANPLKMYRKLCKLTGQRQDPCVLDTFRAAVAQARNPRLPPAQCQWWYWSCVRKANGEKI